MKLIMKISKQNHRHSHRQNIDKATKYMIIKLQKVVSISGNSLAFLCNLPTACKCHAAAHRFGDQLDALDSSRIYHGIKSFQ